MAKHNFTIKALTLDDVPDVAKISADAFKQDRQTVMKGLGSEPFFMEEHALNSLPALFRNPRCVLLKAVDNKSSETLGYINWAFRGFPPNQMPVVEGRIQPLAEPPKMAAETESEDAKSEAEKNRENNPIQKLIALQDADIKVWMDEVMPEGVRCLYVAGLHVAPRHQGRGVGSALLRFGTKFCDENGVFAWVHSSEMAWKAYEKSGFQVIRSQDCDLDAYAPMPPPNEGPDAKWGHYILRYMMYFPIQNQT